MPVYRKPLLMPGVYHTKQGRLRVTADKLRDWRDKGNRMVAKRLAIPVPLNHQPSAKPTPEDQLADLVRNNTGKVVGYEMEGDTLVGYLDVKDSAIAKKIDEHALEHVSVEIEPFQDGDGEDFQDVLTHVAIVTRPVAHRLPGFTRVDTPPIDFDALTKSAGTDGAATDGQQFAFGVGHPVRLSLDQLEKPVDDPKKKKPAKKGKPPQQDADDAADLDEVEEGAEGDQPPVEDDAGDEGEETSLEEGEEGTEAGDPSEEQVVQEVVGKLRDVYDIHLADDTTKENFWERMHAILTHEAGPQQDDATGQGNLKTEEPEMLGGGYMMSHDTPEGKALRKVILADYKRRYKLCLDTGRMTKVDHDRYLKAIDSPTFKLSLDSQGEIVSNAEAVHFLKFSERLPEGALVNVRGRTGAGNGKAGAADRTQLGHDGYVDHEPPAHDEDEAEQERRGHEAGKELASLAGAPQAA